MRLSVLKSSPSQHAILLISNFNQSIWFGLWNQAKESFHWSKWCLFLPVTLTTEATTYPNTLQPLQCRITSTNFKFYPIVVLLTPNNSIRFGLKYKQCRPDQTTSLEASWSESAVSRNIVLPCKVDQDHLVIILIKSLVLSILRAHIRAY